MLNEEHAMKSDDTTTSPACGGEDSRREAERPRRGAVVLRLDTERPFKHVKRELVDSFESAYLVDLVARHGGNLSAASRESLLSRRHLRSLLRKYGLYEAFSEMRGQDA
jgi:DNA-binding NtrC family response regulator